MPDDMTPQVVAPVPEPIVAPVVAEVVAAPAIVPAIAAAPDISVAELDSALRLMEAQLAAGLTTDIKAKEMVLNSIAETEENKQQRSLAVQQLAVEKAQMQHQLQNVLPQALQQYKTELLRINKEDGVPISMLAMAQSEDQIRTITREWVKAHPKTEAKEAVPVVAVVAGGQAVAPPAPTQTPITAPGLDSGLSVGGAVEEPWRGMSAKEKILFGMGIRK